MKLILMPMHRTSIQPAISRPRPPRVRILPSLGDVKDSDAVELPLNIAVIAALSDNPEGAAYRERRFIEIDLDNFDSVLQGMKPRLQFRVENKLTEDADGSKLNVELEFRQLDDFGPNSVARQVSPLRALLEMRTRLDQLCRMIYRNDKVEGLLGQAAYRLNEGIDPDEFVGQIVEEGRLARTEYDAGFAKELVSEYLTQIRTGDITVGRDAESSMRARIAQLDHLVSLQV